LAVCAEASAIGLTGAIACGSIHTTATVLPGSPGRTTPATFFVVDNCTSTDAAEPITFRLTAISPRASRRKPRPVLRGVQIVTTLACRSSSSVSSTLSSIAAADLSAAAPGFAASIVALEAVSVSTVPPLAATVTGCVHS
jgi:hypothetical protein